ncbi:MAG: RagB/SusD family nutrient uptake outer membrane protein [Bacteroidales bacterium]|nr:RagB/SusD family nutrient uptake outer membrane protein [Bacteroidales bacterium]
MKKYINTISGRFLLIFTLIVFSTLSCSKGFLELEPQQAVSMNQALVTAADFRAAITGCYDGLQNSSSYGKFFILVTDVMSDDLKGNAVVNRAADWHSYAGSSSDRSNLAQNIWENYYRIIDRANRILEADTDLDIDDIKGQAYAFRALAYYDLVRIYGQHYTYTADASHMGVPIVTEVDPFQKPARNTVKEVYDQVIEDFTTALGLINDNKNSFYFSQNVIKALLSRVYLYKEDWANAVAMANDVIGSGDYSLVPNADYPTIFSSDHSSESIFEVDMNPVDNLGGGSLASNYLASGYNEYLPTLDLYDTITDGDVRKETMFLEDLSIGGGDFGTLRVYKYTNELGYDNSPVIRLSEVYLTRAEANYHIGTPAAITAAQDDLTLIRQRGLPAAPAVTETGTDLLDEILRERRIELCFEGHRLWDLTRNKMGVYRRDHTSGVSEVPYPDDRFVLAIGLQETEVNDNIIQNPGY